jgi:subtilisin family serine protease
MLLPTLPGPELRVRAVASRDRQAPLVSAATARASGLARQLGELSLQARWDLDALISKGWMLTRVSEEELLAGLVGTEALDPAHELGLLAETPQGQLVIVTARLLVTTSAEPAIAKALLDGVEGLRDVATVELGFFSATLAVRSFAGLYRELSTVSATASDLFARLQDHPLVDTVDVEILERLAWRGSGVLGSTADCSNAPPQPPPNYERYSSHWQQCRCIEPWKEGRFGQDIVVGLLDGGFAASHPDLAPDPESSWFDRWGARHSIASPSAAGLANYGMPCEVHGTQCAGLVAAKHNGFGVRGAAPACRLLLAAIGDVTSQLRLALALRWLGRAGAKVVSCSLGVDHPRWWLLARALDRVLDHISRKAVVCWAVANEPNLRVADDFIASRGDVLAVGAIDAAWQRPTGAVGPELDLVAPGWAIWTTTTRAQGYEQELGGSSLAAPIVAGIAAVVLAARTLTPKEAAILLRNAAAPIGQRPNDRFGHGCVDAEQAVCLALGLP